MFHSLPIFSHPPKQAHRRGPLRIAFAERRVKPLARLLRRATALRVTAPHGCGSRRLVWPKGSFRRFPHNMNDNILYHALATPAPAAPRQAIMPDRSLTYSRAGGVRNSFPILLVSTV